MQIAILYHSPYGNEGFVYVEAQDLCDRTVLDASAELERQGFEVSSIDTYDAPKQVLQ